MDAVVFSCIISVFNFLQDYLLIKPPFSAGDPPPLISAQRSPAPICPGCPLRLICSCHVVDVFHSNRMLGWNHTLLDLTNTLFDSFVLLEYIIKGL